MLQRLSDIADIVVKVQMNEELTAIESIKMGNVVFSGLKAAENTVYQHSLGAVSDEALRAARATLVGRSSATFVLTWEERRDEFTEDFNKFMEGVKVERLDHDPTPVVSRPGVSKLQLSD